MSYRYNLSDEEIRLAYGEVLQHLKTVEIQDTNYHEDIGLLMAQINTLMSDTRTPEEDLGINLDKWKLVIELIKLKAALIKENRIERERQQKMLERRMKLESIPLDDYRNAIAAVIGIVCKYVEPQHMSGVISELSEITAHLNSRTQNG